jgi:histidinol-phosphate/aromatic aminotransferase/cobyric acid decarboxylase-like protein
MKTVRLLVEEKERLFALLSSPMFAPYLRPVPSKANFVLCEVQRPASAPPRSAPEPLLTRHDTRQILPSAALSAVEVAQGLRKRGILIRYFGSQGGALQNYIRISSSLPWHTDRVIHALALLLLPPVPRVATPPPTHACRVSCRVSCGRFID